jgi:diacylglycerol kinase family enzyme
MAANYRTFVVANPKAGAGTVERSWERVERLLRAKLPEFDYAFTEGPRHATLLTREALRSGWEMVVCVGGDGTLNEVVNGFWEELDGPEQFELDEEGWMVRRGPLPDPIAEDAVLGVIPIGTGGDFRRTIGLMGDHTDTIERLGGRRTRSIDVGQVGFVDHDDAIASRLFINISSAGLSGLIDKYVNRTWKGFGGRTSFIVGSFRGYLDWSNLPVVARLDETHELDERIANLVVANGEFFGGGMWIAPGAEIDDGHFQVVVLGDAGFIESLGMLGRLYSGRHLELESVHRHSARRVTARPKRAGDVLLLDLDGEQPGRLPALWSNHAGALSLKV